MLGNLFRKRRHAFGQGRRVLEVSEIRNALVLKSAGLSDRQVSVKTGLNRATVGRIWTNNGALEARLERMARDYLKNNPEKVEALALHYLLSRLRNSGGKI